MSCVICYMIFICAIPLCAIIVDFVTGSSMIERHHTHHDTYEGPRSLSTALVLMMLFVAVFAEVLLWLTSLGVFQVDISALAMGFAAFLCVGLILWLAMRRYRVVTYTDRLKVTPFFGCTKTIKYSDIKRLVWYRPLGLMAYQSLKIYAQDDSGTKQSVFLWGNLDLNQILARIDRFDVLE